MAVERRMTDFSVVNLFDQPQITELYIPRIEEAPTFTVQGKHIYGLSNHDKNKYFLWIHLIHVQLKGSVKWMNIVSLNIRI